MAHDPFSAHTFDPEVLRLLYAAFDAAWKVVEERTPAFDHARVRDAIASAVVALAQARQFAPRGLRDRSSPSCGWLGGGPPFVHASASALT
jgi:alkylation response protein AidB-like acyl-CoA dehydrogenase